MRLAKEKEETHLIVQIRCHDSRIVLIPLYHCHPVIHPSIIALTLIPPLVPFINSTAPFTLICMIIQNHRKTPSRQRLNTLIVNLQRRHTLELRICLDPIVLDYRGVVEHLVRPLETDGVNAELFEGVKDLGDGDVLEGEEHYMRILVGMVGRVEIDIS